MISYCGMIASWVGRRYIDSSTPKKNFLPGKSYLAKAKAASESKNSTRSVVQTATTTVLNSDPKKSILSNRCWMLVTRFPPNHSFGG